MKKTPLCKFKNEKKRSLLGNITILIFFFYISWCPNYVMEIFDYNNIQVISHSTKFAITASKGESVSI